MIGFEAEGEGAVGGEEEQGKTIRAAGPETWGRVSARMMRQRERGGKEDREHGDDADGLCRVFSGPHPPSMGVLLHVGMESRRAQKDQQNAEKMQQNLTASLSWLGAAR